ncbi:MAG: lipoate--protein ligase family protein [Chlamydiales bacterium]|nr:lipoate--protein ligase family protein [Chlamydiales bacterium]
MWNIIDSGVQSAKVNMEMDEELLQHIKEGDDPILHFYDWAQPSITYGYFINKDKLLHHHGLQKWSLDMARRPTGGGIVFHLWDLAFSVIVPASHEGFFENTMENYRYINQKVLAAAMKYLHLFSPMELLQQESLPMSKDCAHFCMAKPTQYDVMMKGKKIAGAAQRRKRHGYLHQGTIALAKPIEHILQDTLIDPKVIEAMGVNTFYFLQEGWSAQDLTSAREKFKFLLKQSFVETKFDMH